MTTTPVIEREPGIFEPIVDAQLTSLDGERVAPIGVVLHESWTDEERAEFGVFLAIDAEVPAGKVVTLSRYERVDGAVRQVIEVEDAPVVIPRSVTPRQLRLALLGAGKLEQVQAFVDGGGAPPAAKISWEYATEFLRDDPMLNGLAGALKPPMSQGQIDQLFIAAAQIR